MTTSTQKRKLNRAYHSAAGPGMKHTKQDRSRSSKWKRDIKREAGLQLRKKGCPCS